MRTLNLGILAHVDAGKTSLTERLLHSAGVIDEIGSVDAGSTQTDSLALERQRGITIKSAVVSFVVGDVTVNLIDTPGHPDFIAEVERVLGVLDGTVLVISAVEGVQAQTRVLMRALRRLRIPTIIFVNKTDRAGAHTAGVLAGIAERLTPAIVAMGSVTGLGTVGCAFRPYGPGDAAFTARLAEVLAEHDEDLLADYVRDETGLSHRRLSRALAGQARRGLVHPVFFGSAITGAGVAELAAGLTRFLPATHGDAAGPVSGAVFKVERGPAGEKIAYARMFSGALHVRDRMPPGGDQRITAISVFERGPAVRREQVRAGQIGKLWGLRDIQIGDTLGAPPAGRPRHRFAPPTLETVVTPRRRADKGALHTALTQLAEQDPLIGLRRDDVRGELLLSLYGEVQKEVIQATLASEYGVEAAFSASTTICIERPAGSGAAFEIIDTPPNPFLATVGLRIDPAPVGSGVRFRLEVELGSMPFAFFKAVEETVAVALQQGLHGWQVTDCVVSMTHSGYWPRQSHAHAHFDKSMSSTAGDFRNLTPLVLMDALKRAGTGVYEPVHRFHLEIPADTYASVLPVLARLRAIPGGPFMRGALCLLDGEIPAAQVRALEEQLPGLTRGEGVLEAAFGHYQPVRGGIPERPRTDHNPLNREEYLLRVVRRVAAR
ncbi:MAG TPA: translation factor GTPase family protein [Streptosporangiaceae bacterium]|nr:translation factor GTPase family protein [Streptosporangiaceae bacterium]